MSATNQELTAPFDENVPVFVEGRKLPPVSESGWLLLKQFVEQQDVKTVKHLVETKYYDDCENWKLMNTALFHNNLELVKALLPLPQAISTKMIFGSLARMSNELKDLFFEMEQIQVMLEEPEGQSIKMMIVKDSLRDYESLNYFITKFPAMFKGIPPVNLKKPKEYDLVGLKCYNLLKENNKLISN
jgi:hypothetical protein